MSQEIEDNFLPTASGDGLQCGVENVTSVFEVQSVGQQGDLAVNIVGASLTARTIDEVGQLLGRGLVSKDCQLMKSLNHDTCQLSRHDSDVKNGRR